MIRRRCTSRAPGSSRGPRRSTSCAGCRRDRTLRPDRRSRASSRVRCPCRCGRTGLDGGVHGVEGEAVRGEEGLLAGGGGWGGRGGGGCGRVGRECGGRQGG